METGKPESGEGGGGGWGNGCCKYHSRCTGRAVCSRAEAAPVPPVRPRARTSAWREMEEEEEEEEAS